MRKRTNTRALVLHAYNGKFILSRQEKLRKKFEGGEISPEELREYSELLHQSTKKSNTVILSVFGKRMEVFMLEYKEHEEAMKPFRVV